MDLANQALELWWTEHPSFSAIASDPAGDLSEPRHVPGRQDAPVGVLSTLGGVPRPLVDDVGHVGPQLDQPAVQSVTVGKLAHRRID